MLNKTLGLLLLTSLFCCSTIASANIKHSLYANIGAGYGLAFNTTYNNYGQLNQMVDAGQINLKSFLLRGGIGYSYLRSNLYLATELNVETYLSGNLFTSNEAQGPNYSLDSLGTLDITKGLSGIGISVIQKGGYAFINKPDFKFIGYAIGGYTARIYNDRHYTQAEITPVIPVNPVKPDNILEVLAEVAGFNGALTQAGISQINSGAYKLSDITLQPGPGVNGALYVDPLTGNIITSGSGHYDSNNVFHKPIEPNGNGIWAWNQGEINYIGIQFEPSVQINNMDTKPRPINQIYPNIGNPPIMINAETGQIELPVPDMNHAFSYNGEVWLAPWGPDGEKLPIQGVWPTPSGNPLFSLAVCLTEPSGCTPEQLEASKWDFDTSPKELSWFLNWLFYEKDVIQPAFNLNLVLNTNGENSINIPLNYKPELYDTATDISATANIVTTAQIVQQLQQTTEGQTIIDNLMNGDNINAFDIFVLESNIIDSNSFKTTSTSELVATGSPFINSKHGIELGLGALMQFGTRVSIFVDITSPIFIGPGVFTPSFKTVAGFKFNL